MSGDASGSGRRLGGAALLLAGFGLFNVLPVTPASWHGGLAIGGIVVLALSVGILDWGAVCCSLLCAAVLVSGWVNPWRWWPMHLLVPLAGFAVVVGVVPQLRRSIEWPGWGRFDRVTIGLSVLTVVASSGALVLWYVLARPDVGDIRAMIPPLPRWMLPLACLVFAVVNALMEEAVWRWVLWTLLGRAIPGVGAVVALQAASFGLYHINGFPRGWIGVAMAGLYGLFLGLIRWRSGGLLPPVVAHVFADVTIFAILVLTIGE
ncbi:MAG: CPBP family intramembrane metalloprotease [Phycisphaerae bacterium]|nr:CPBP family intramembrane metalloprotease [Phycisphaerae bacterium]